MEPWRPVDKTEHDPARNVTVDLFKDCQKPYFRFNTLSLWHPFQQPWEVATAPCPLSVPALVALGPRLCSSSLSVGPFPISPFTVPHRSATHWHCSAHSRVPTTFSDLKWQCSLPLLSSERWKRFPSALLQCGRDDE